MSDTPANEGGIGKRSSLTTLEMSDSPDQAKQLAERIALAKNLDPNASGRWRVRKLLAEVNERQGYQISGYAMRVNSEEEQRLAGELAAIVQKQGGAAFTVTRTSFPTPWYISVFVCPGAQKPSRDEYGQASERRGHDATNPLAPCGRAGSCSLGRLRRSRREERPALHAGRPAQVPPRSSPRYPGDLRQSAAQAQVASQPCRDQKGGG